MKIHFYYYGLFFSGYPQSCICVENGVTTTQCNSIFQCPCECDLIAGECDYNCCCDPDCSPSQVNIIFFR